MKFGLGFPHNSLSDENLRYAKQLGVTHIIVHSPRPIIEGEQDYRHRGMAFSLGYMKALMDIANR